MHDDGDDDAVHVGRAARVVVELVETPRQHARVVLASLRRRQHHRELEQTPRPDGEHDLAQQRVVAHLERQQS